MRQELKQNIDQMCDYIRAKDMRAAIGTLFALKVALGEIEVSLKELERLKERNMTLQKLLEVMDIK